MIAGILPAFCRHLQFLRFIIDKQSAVSLKFLLTALEVAAISFQLLLTAES